MEEFRSVSMEVVGSAEGANGPIRKERRLTEGEERETDNFLSALGGSPGPLITKKASTPYIQNTETPGLDAPYHSKRETEAGVELVVQVENVTVLAPRSRLLEG